MFQCIDQGIDINFFLCLFHMIDTISQIFIERVIKFLRIDFSVLIQYMTINFCNHIGL